MDVWEEWFKLVAYTREVRFHRFRFNVMTHVDSVETEGVGGGLDWEVMLMEVN